MTNLANAIFLEANYQDRQTATYSDFRAGKRVMSRKAFAGLAWVRRALNSLKTEAEASELTCACGHTFPAKLGKYGCPNCNGHDYSGDNSWA